MKISSSHGLKAGDSEDVCCVICRDYLHVSAVVCSCCHRPVCVRHINQQCECPMSSRTLLYRFTLAELFDMRDRSRTTEMMEIDGRQGVKRDAQAEVLENQGAARFYAFLDQWKCQTEMILDSVDACSSDMETLLYEGMQFLWAGHEVDAHRTLYIKLKDAIEWFNGLERLGQCTESKATVEELKELIDKTPRQSKHPGAVRLKEMLKHVQDWIMETERVLHPSADIELDDLLAFYERGQEMHVLLPGLNLIKERVADAAALQKSIVSVFDTSDTAKLHSVSELQTLVQRAKDLKIVFPQRQKLDRFLLIIDDWIVNARSRQDENFILTDLQDLLSEVSLQGSCNFKFVSRWDVWLPIFLSCFL